MPHMYRFESSNHTPFGDYAKYTQHTRMHAIHIYHLRSGFDYEILMIANCEFF